jgi:hypothetical protein
LGTLPIVDIGAYEASPSLAATAGGPYLVGAGGQVALTAAGASGVAGPLTFDWDLNNDGVFSDASGAVATFQAGALSVGSVVTVAVRLKDASASTIVAMTTVRVVAPTLYVDERAPGNGNGTSWTNAYTSLSGALASALSGQTIEVATGVYRPIADRGRRSTFRVPSGVAVLGGYAGYGAVNPDARNTSTFGTTLSGDIGAPNITSDNTYHVLTIISGASGTVVDGFTIIAGSANGADDHEQFGGGVFIRSGAPVVSNCQLLGNVSSYGGGAYLAASAARISGCVFLGDRGGTSGYGGGAYSDAASPVFDGCQFVRNTAYGGGGLFIQSGSASLVNCAVLGNSAAGGGGIAFDSASMSVANCDFVGNTASANGGGCASESSQSTFNGCTFTANDAYEGGAGYLDESQMSLVNCIFWGDHQTYGEIGTEFGNFGTRPTFNYCDIPTSLGTGNINVDPRFARTPVSGPDATWGTADDDYGDLRLQAGSPCIDTGNTASVASGVTTDLAGKGRVLGLQVDMGAYERGTPLLVSGVDSNDSFSIRVSPDGLNLEVWINSSTFGSPDLSLPASTVESATFNGGSGDDSLVVDLSNGMPADIAFAGGPGNDSVTLKGLPASAILNDQSGWMSFGQAAVSLTGSETTRIDTATSGSALNVVAANVANPLVLTAGRGIVFRPWQLNFAPGGTLDLTDNTLIASATVATIQGYLNGGQLFTTATSGALGYLNLGGGLTEVRFTLLGDTNLDGKVDVTDLGNLASHYGAGSGAVWVQGDTNYDGKVDVTDLGNLATNYGGTLGGGPSASAIPAAEVAATTQATAAPPQSHTVGSSSPVAGSVIGAATGSNTTSVFRQSNDPLYLQLERSSEDDILSGQRTVGKSA